MKLVTTFFSFLEQLLFFFRATIVEVT